MLFTSHSSPLYFSLLASAALPLLAADRESAGSGEWHDARSLTLEGRGWEKTESPYDRLPLSAKDKVPEAVWKVSHQTAGVCVRFTTDSPTLQVHWKLTEKPGSMPHMASTGTSGVDLYSRARTGRPWRFVGNGRPADLANTAAFSLPLAAEYLLYFPLYNGVESLELGIPAGYHIAKADGPSRRPIVFYGTSITQGACASRPGMAAPSIVGRKLQIPIINLGFNGCGKMELPMADLLGELDPTVFVIDCLWNMDTEMVRERVEPFVRKLRTVRPSTPILLVEDSSFLDASPTEKGALLTAAVQDLRQHGVTNLFLLSSKGMLGDDWEGTVDGVHPNDLGMTRSSKVLSAELQHILASQKK